MPKEEVSKFITYMDFLNKYLDNNKIILFKTGKVVYCMQYINEFLLNCCINKAKTSFNKHLLSPDEFVDFIVRFVLAMIYSMKRNDILYKISVADYLKDQLTRYMLENLDNASTIINIIDEYLEYEAEQKIKCKKYEL